MRRFTPWTVIRYLASLVAIGGFLAVLLSPFIGDTVTDQTFLIEPMAYFGGIAVIVSLIIVWATFILHRPPPPEPVESNLPNWSRLTQEYFEVFGHDLGRPLRRILGKARDLRIRIEESGANPGPHVLDLLDEIDQQAPNFRLMVSNVQVLIELEDLDARPRTEPTDPAQIIRSIVDRYSRVAADRGAEISWWSEPSEFGVVYSDGAALDHVVTNLVDNAVKHTTEHVEIRLTRNPTHFFIRVWDDGPGIPSRYLPHIFDRGWTPEAASRQERTSSGLGLFIVRTLVRRLGGEVTIDSVTQSVVDPGRTGNGDYPNNSGHHTIATVMLPLLSPQSWNQNYTG